MVSLPALPVFEIAKERGYFNVAYNPVGRLMKRLVGVAGDRVTIDAAGVEVNGIRLVNKHAAQGRRRRKAVRSLCAKRSLSRSG
jgi:type IV secretory pathway protease TraF